MEYVGKMTLFDRKKHKAGDTPDIVQNVNFGKLFDQSTAYIGAIHGYLYKINLDGKQTLAY